MSTASLERAEASADLIERPPYRLTAEEFFRAVEADVFPPESRLGLWDGWIYEKMAKRLPHAGASSLIIHALFRLVPEGWCLWPENPILVNDFTAPLPDMAIVRGTPRDYTQRKSVPGVDDIGLVVELADATLKKNRTNTLQIYAKSGLPVYWIVNLVARRVEVYSRPVVDADPARYDLAEVFEPGEVVPVVLGGVEVAQVPVDDLLP